MQSIIVYIIVAVTAIITIAAVIKRFLPKKGKDCVTCEGCTLKDSCNRKT